MSANVASVLTDISALNTEVQSIRDFITANPVPTPDAVQQISDATAVLKTNVDGLKGQLGVS